ncbi:MAG: N-acetylmuramoyl-L-alanine amidase [Clostridium sp.]|nr:N-acetylmuramoyl-L-alanine amidase [Clostridium sp.]
MYKHSSTASAAKGGEVYYSIEKPNSGTAYSNKISKSKELATNISRELSNGISTTNKGSRDEDFYVVKNTHMPSILIECGFITNK